jgi:hypothetical protein
MVDHELIERVTRLPISQRLGLIELLTRSLRSDIPSESAGRTEGAELVNASRGQSADQPSLSERAAALTRLFGALSDDPRPPTDEEWKEDHINYLTRKYE